MYYIVKCNKSKENMKTTGLFFTSTSTKTLAQNTGIYTSGITVFPCYGFNANGTPLINPQYCYLGIESGKYPYVIRPTSMDDNNMMEKLYINFGERVDLKNIYIYAGSGNGVYVIY